MNYFQACLAVWISLP